MMPILSESMAIWLLIALAGAGALSFTQRRKARELPPRDILDSLPALDREARLRAGR